MAISVASVASDQRQSCGFELLTLYAGVVVCVCLPGHSQQCAIYANEVGQDAS